MKAITKSKPYFDKQGNLYMPNDLKFGGEVNPSLNPKEWWFLILEIANKSKITEKKYRELVDILIGSKQTKYRIKKSLKEKGYL